MIAPLPTVLIRPIRPEEHYALGELTVAAYHSLPDVMDHQDAYDRQLRDVARRAETSCVLVAVGPEGELLGGVTYVCGPDDPYSEELTEGEAGMRMLAVDPGPAGAGNRPPARPGVPGPRPRSGAEVPRPAYRRLDAGRHRPVRKDGFRPQTGDRLCACPRYRPYRLLVRPDRWRARLVITPPLG